MTGAGFGDGPAGAPADDTGPELPVDVPEPRQATVVVRFDDVVDGFFSRIRGNVVVDRFFYTASELANDSLLWHLLAVERGLRRGGDLEGTVRIVTLMGVESFVVNWLVKSLFRRTRPLHDEPRPFRLRTPKTSSFPSGHATAAAVFTVVAGEGSRLAPLYGALGVTVAVSRIHVRIHHASDVVGGAVIGTALGLALRQWWPADQRWPKGLGPR